MIQALLEKKNSYSIPLNDGARKVFDEATGAGLIPEIEDRFDEMAADFLEKWVVSSNDPFQASEPEIPNQGVISSAKDTPRVPVFQPEMTTFSIDLDWKFSDETKLA